MDRTNGISVFCYAICALGVILMFCGHPYLGIVVSAVSFVLGETISMPSTMSHSDYIKKTNAKTLREDRERKRKRDQEEHEHFVYWNMYNKRGGKR